MLSGGEKYFYYLFLPVVAIVVLVILSTPKITQMIKGATGSSIAVAYAKGAIIAFTIYLAQMFLDKWRHEKIDLVE